MSSKQQHPLLLLHIQNQTKNNKIMMQVFVGKKKKKKEEARHITVSNNIFFKKSIIEYEVCIIFLRNIWGLESGFMINLWHFPLLGNCAC